MKLALAQLNTTVGDIPENCQKMTDIINTHASNHDAIIFSECSLTGYPPQDLLSYPTFIDHIHATIKDLCNTSKATPDTSIIFGSPYLKDNTLLNAAICIKNGQIVTVQGKKNLPNYDIFDEKRYFIADTDTCLLNINGMNVGLTICEDAWIGPEHMGAYRQEYHADPVSQCCEKGAEIIINLSASPFELGKQKQRETIFKTQARKHKIPIVMVNQVGANDQLIFDGQSFVINASGDVCSRLPAFKEHVQTVNIPCKNNAQTTSRTDIQDLHDALVMGIHDYVKKTGFKSVCLGVSGGIDSAVTAALAVKALGPDNVTGLSMPSQFSSEGSKDDATALAENTGMTLHSLPITPIYEQSMKSLDPILSQTNPDTTEENIQARIRGLMVMAQANKKNALALTTGNKSELAMGYCTLYGDMCGALAVLADVPKTMVFELARYINQDKKYIPENSITKPPSAELRPGQKDSDSLPPYDVLDAIITQHIDEQQSTEQLIQNGFDPALVTDIVKKINQNEYKRKQGATALRITSKSFGQGRRMPLAARYLI